MKHFDHGDCIRVTDDNSPFFGWVGRVKTHSAVNATPLRPVYRVVAASSVFLCTPMSLAVEPQLHLTFRGEQLSKVLDQMEIKALRDVFQIAGDTR